jgi:hypothetical protein|nr:MAG TPA: hypothetical protein [Caudoviricetes sp.]
MACPRSFFDFNTACFRLSEVVAIYTEGCNLVVELRGGKTFSHRDYNGSAAKLQARLLHALAMEEL